MTKVFFATNRKSDDPSHVGGFGANIVGLNPNEITFASVEIARTERDVVQTGSPLVEHVPPRAGLVARLQELDIDIGQFEQTRSRAYR